MTKNLFLSYLDMSESESSMGPDSGLYQSSLQQVGASETMQLSQHFGSSEIESENDYIIKTETKSNLSKMLRQKNDKSFLKRQHEQHHWVTAPAVPKKESLSTSNKERIKELLRKYFEPFTEVW